MATASAAAVGGADAGLAVPVNRGHRPSYSEPPNEWQDIRDMLGFSSQTGSKPPGSGSSDPGSQSTGAKDKSPRLPKLFNSGGSVKGEKSSNSHQLRPPGMSKTPSPVVQIQVHLLPGNTNETAAAAVNNIHQQQRPRRHSLERFVSNSCQKPVWA